MTLDHALHALSSTEPHACRAREICIKESMMTTGTDDSVVVFSVHRWAFWARIFSAHLANVTRTKFKSWKKKVVGVCEAPGCDMVTTLQTAHRRGLGRNMLVRRAMQALAREMSTGRYALCVSSLQQYYWSEHARTPHRAVFCLCYAHHREYDRGDAARQTRAKDQTACENTGEAMS